MKAFLSRNELSIGHSTIPKDGDAKYFTSHVEPRADEWAANSRGETVFEFDEKVAATASIRSREEIDVVADGQQQQPSSDDMGKPQDA